MTIKVLVNGAFGRMGQLVVKTVTQHPGLQLVGQTGREYDLKTSIADSHAEVVIDFTEPDTLFTTINAIIEAGARPVIGTSGLQSDQIKTLQEKCLKLKRGGIIAPNFSLGAVMMMKCVKEIATYMHHAEIIEMHHDNKADSPSATALRTADILSAACPNINQPCKSSRETIKGARGANQHGIPIHAIRLPGKLAHQQVIFGSTGETLTLQHDSLDRECFMPGIVLACQKVMTLDHLVYGLEEIL